MRLRTSTILSLSLVLLAGLGGCKDRRAALTKYHYALEKLNKRWTVVRDSFKTSEPNVYLVTVLQKDFADLVTAMERTYTASNRDEVVPKLKELATTFTADINAVVGRTASGQAELKPGATTQDVSKVVEKGYADYQELEKLVKK